MTNPRRNLALILRLAGPSLQVVCLIGLLAPGSEGRAIAGLPLRNLSIIGFGVGLLMVAIGLGLSLAGGQANRGATRDVDLVDVDGP